MPCGLYLACFTAMLSVLGMLLYPCLFFVNVLFNYEAVIKGPFFILRWSILSPFVRCYCSLQGVRLWMGSRFGFIYPLYAAAAALVFATCYTGPSSSIESTKVLSVVMLGSAGRNFFVLFSFIRFYTLPEVCLTCYCKRRSLSWFANWKSTWLP